MAADPAPVTIRIRRGWALLEGLAAVLAVVVGATDLVAGDWVTGVVLVVLAASLGFQTAQAWGTLTVHADGVDDARILGAGRVAWSDVDRVRLGTGGWIRPPMLIDVDGRQRPVAASSPWTLQVRSGGEPVDWDAAREVISAHARASGATVVRLGRRTD